jgi:hypothetical protein
MNAAHAKTQENLNHPDSGLDEGTAFAGEPASGHGAADPSTIDWEILAALLTEIRDLLSQLGKPEQAMTEPSAWSPSAGSSDT